MSDDGDDGSDSGTDSGPNPAIRLLQTVTPGVIRRSFAIKFGLVLLVMALSIGAIGLFATQAITAQTEDNAESEFQSGAGQQADIIEQWLARSELRTETLSSRQLDWRGDDPQTLSGRLSREQESEGVAELHLFDDLDTQGPTIVASTSLDAGTQLGNPDRARSWVTFEALSAVTDLPAPGVYTSDTYEVDGEQYIGFISPVDGERYLFLEMAVSDVQESLRGADADTDVGFTQVVDTGPYFTDEARANTVMIDGRGSERGKVNETYATDDGTLEPLRRAAQLDPAEQRAGVIASVSADADVIDEEYTVGYAPVADSDWVVLTHGPRSEVFGFVDTLSTWGLFITLFAVLLIAVTGSALGYSTATAIDRLTSKTDQMRAGNLDVELSSSRVDNIGRLYDGFADMRDALKQQIEESDRAREEAEVARAEAEDLATYLQERAEEYSEIMQQVSAGDMTQRMTEEGEEESMDRIAAEFNDMIEELEKTVGQLKDYVDEVEEAGAEVEQSSDTVREASEQVADSIQKISDDAYDQQERLQDISEMMDGIAGQLESVEDEDIPEVQNALADIRDVAGELNDVADLSEETLGEAEQVAGAAQEQAAELNEVSERANDLQRYAQPLRDILQRFQTEAKHEFVFSVGPTGGSASPGSGREETDDENDSESEE
jgi:methyl-accepting chemotaxis protein